MGWELAWKDLEQWTVLELNHPEFESALNKYQQKRDQLNQRYMEMQQTKQPSEKQSKNWVSVAEIQELIRDRGPREGLGRDLVASRSISPHRNILEGNSTSRLYQL